jgi:hypothetical protein
MAKKSMLEREKKRKKLVKKYAKKRKNLLDQLKKLKNLEEIYSLNEKLQKLPRNSSKIIQIYVNGVQGGTTNTLTIKILWSK